MAVLINFKICDNAEECGGIEVCPSGALSWDKKKKTIKIDNAKCVACGQCEKNCPVGAIRVAKNDKEYEKIKKEIALDPRCRQDLFVDRYGAQPVGTAFLNSEKKFNFEYLRSQKLMMVEFFNEKSIMCLLHSIPIREIAGDFAFNYEKIKLKTKSLMEKFGILELPALLFFKKGELIGKIEGYYGIADKSKIKSEVAKIMRSRR